VADPTFRVLGSMIWIIFWMDMPRLTGFWLGTSGTKLRPSTMDASPLPLIANETELFNRSKGTVVWRVGGVVDVKFPESTQFVEN